MRRVLSVAPELITGPPEAAELLTQTEKQAAEPLEELRELAHRIYAPLSAELGLPIAVEAQARKLRSRSPKSGRDRQVPAADRGDRLLLRPGSAAEHREMRAGISGPRHSLP
jgi:signal transduction histidine kinase